MVRTDLNLPHHSSTKMFLNKSSQNTMYIFTCDFTSLTFRCIKIWFHLFILRFISSVLLIIVRILLKNIWQFCFNWLYLFEIFILFTWYFCLFVFIFLWMIFRCICCSSSHHLQEFWSLELFQYYVRLSEIVIVLIQICRSTCTFFLKPLQKVYQSFVFLHWQLLNGFRKINNHFYINVCYFYLRISYFVT